MAAQKNLIGKNDLLPKESILFILYRKVKIEVKKKDKVGNLYFMYLNMMLYKLMIKSHRSMNPCARVEINRPILI